MINGDCHLHTSYSADGFASMEEMILGSLEAGMEAVVFTDHVDFVYGEPTPYLIDYHAYTREFQSLRERYGGRIHMTLGVEVGLEVGYNHIVEDFVKSFDFDFVIGSTHVVDSMDLALDRDRFFSGKTKAASYGGYLEAVLENARYSQYTTVFGHLDYAGRYGVYEDNFLYYEEHGEILDEILKTIIRKDMGLEINTSGYRYGLSRPHPYENILRRYKELGGEIITAGSDAHRPEDIACCFDKAAEVLKKTGFKAYTLFREGKLTWEDL